jgi:hypothetical protein
MEISDVLKLLAEARDTLHTCDEHCDSHSCLSNKLEFDSIIANFMKILKQKNLVKDSLKELYPFVWIERVEHILEG